MTPRRLAPLLLCASIAAGKEKPFPAEHLPSVAKVEQPAPLEPFSRMTFQLDAHGRLSFEGRLFTLNEFSKTILRHTEFRSVELKRKGKPPLDDLGGDVEGSNVEVLLRVHREAPWRQVTWMLMVMQEERAYKSEFVARDGDGREGVVRAWIPLGKKVEGGIEFDADDEEDEAKPPPPPPRGTVLVTLLASGARPREYGDGEVDAPEEIQYAVGKKKMRLSALRTNVRSAFRSERGKAKSPRIEIRAAARVPHGAVLEVLDLLRLDAYERIEFGDLPIPDREVRMAKPLPYPKR